MGSLYQTPQKQTNVLLPDRYAKLHQNTINYIKPLFNLIIMRQMIKLIMTYSDFSVHERAIT